MSGMEYNPIGIPVVFDQYFVVLSAVVVHLLILVEFAHPFELVLLQVFGEPLLFSLLMLGL
jgi:hypothetical protein